MNPQQPSLCRSLLKSLEGKRISNIGRTINCSRDEYISEFGIKNEDFFMLNDGQTFIEFDDGILLGLMYSLTKKILVVWNDDEVDFSVQQPKPTRFEGKIIKISSNQADKKAFSETIGKRICSISIATLKMSSFSGDEPSLEVGLIFDFESEERLIIGSSVIDDMSVGLVVYPSNTFKLSELIVLERI